jgi:hypothetical protein
MAKACTPANIYGPFTQTLFLGCSVRSFNCTVGWNEQTTSLSVDLIEDPCAGNKVYYPYPGATRTWTQADPGFEAYNQLLELRFILSLVSLSLLELFSLG